MYWVGVLLSEEIEKFYCRSKKNFLKKIKSIKFIFYIKKKLLVSDIFFLI